MSKQDEIPLIRRLQKYGKLNVDEVYRTFFGWDTTSDDKRPVLSTAEYTFFMKLVRLMHANTDTQIKKRVQDKMKIHLRMTKLPRNRRIY